MKDIEKMTTPWIAYKDQKPDPKIADQQGLLIWQYGEYPSTWTEGIDVDSSVYFTEEWGYTHWMYIPKVPNAV
ncbi:MAG: hypothetical protein WCO84_05840 [bacterium]